MDDEDGAVGGSPVCIVHSRQLLDASELHPRFTGRGKLVHSLIDAYGLLDNLKVVEPGIPTSPVAGRKQLLSFHSRDYVQFLETHSNEEEFEMEEAEGFGLAYDCPVFKDVFRYVSAIAESSLCAARLLAEGEALVAINWHGGWHHGKKDEASGFCYCNDIVLAILRLMSAFERVLYIDLDIHHGDGVEDAFAFCQQVLTLSFHHLAPGYFPGTGSLCSVGSGNAEFYSVNVPLEEGISDGQFVSLFDRIASRVREHFSPQVVVLQCGADLLVGDPLGCFSLSPAGAGRCVDTVLHWKLPTLLLGGGGYNFPNTARFWTLCTGLALGQTLSNDIPEHQSLDEYGPSFQLHFAPGNRPNLNSDSHIECVLQTVSDNLLHIKTTS